MASINEILLKSFTNQYLENCMTNRASRWVLMEQDVLRTSGGFGKIGFSSRLQMVNQANKLFGCM